jgi:hypothetical protein
MYRMHYRFAERFPVINGRITVRMTASTTAMRMLTIIDLANPYNTLCDSGYCSCSLHRERIHPADPAEQARFRQHGVRPLLVCNWINQPRKQCVVRRGRKAVRHRRAD